MLARVDSYPYLGVTISSDLKWHNHISHITAKASRALGFVRRNVYNYCPSEVKSLAYTSLMRPQLEYASAAWNPYLVGDIQQLEKVQRRAARFVFRDYKYTTSVTGLLERLQWPLLSTRRTNSRLALFYKGVLYTTRLVSLFIIYRNHCETPDQQTTQHSSHYQHARTHICFHFSLGLLPIGTNCHANSA